MPRKILNWLSDLSPRKLLILAGVSAVIMFVILYGVISTITKDAEETAIQEKSTPVIATGNVIVARANIPAKTLIKNEMLEMKEIPQNLIPEGAITNPSDLLNKPTAVEIFSGDIFTEQKISKENNKAGFVGTIPPNCRAVSVSINDVTGVAGFAKPGDYVDVILVEKNESKVTSSILLQNVLLLSINDNMGVNKPSDNDKVDPATQAIANPAIATLALNPESVLKLVSSSKLGEIYLMLRPLHPSSNYVYVDDFTIKTEKVQETPPPPPAPEPEKKEEVKPEPEKVEPPPEVKPETFEIIYGDLPSVPEDEKKDSSNLPPAEVNQDDKK